MEEALTAYELRFGPNTLERKEWVEGEREFVQSLMGLTTFLSDSTFHTAAFIEALKELKGRSL